GSVLFSGPILKTVPTGAVTSTAPVLSIASNHSGPGNGGNFVQGRQGTYTIGVSNAGGAATSGATSVTDALPAHMTAVSISGAPDSTCTLATLQGTSNKVVEPGGR